MLARTVLAPVLEILNVYGKMAFMSGPRQVGKTTLAKQILKTYPTSLYFNWDILTDKKKLLKDPYFFEHENREPGVPFGIVLDEIHKYARWKNYLKGVYDRNADDFRFLVTGSGRLDLYKKGGDSLLGRYRAMPLFPLTLGELKGVWRSPDDFKQGLLAAPPPASNEDRRHYEGLC